jgi:hypothetical protein
LSTKWKDVLFSEGSLLDMEDPWTKKKELKLEGLEKEVVVAGSAGVQDDGFDALWGAKTQAKLAFTCKHTFERWDFNKDGVLDVDEFNACMVELCLRLGMPKPSWGETQAMFEMLDLDHSGSVSYEEFHQWWTNMFVVDRWDSAKAKDVSGVAERVEIDWRWRGDFATLDVLPDLPAHEPDPRTHPEDYKNWMKLKFEYQKRIAEVRFR